MNEQEKGRLPTVKTLGGFRVIENQWLEEDTIYMTPRTYVKLTANLFKKHVTILGLDVALDPTMPVNEIELHNPTTGEVSKIKVANPGPGQSVAEFCDAYQENNQ
jgi:hypothetical protein